MGTDVVLVTQGNDRKKAGLSEVRQQPHSGNGTVIRRSADEYPALRKVWPRLDARLVFAAFVREIVVLELRQSTGAIRGVFSVQCRLLPMRPLRASVH